MTDTGDILIVGAGTAGTYLGWLIAKKGYQVTIVERDARNHVGQRLEVIHFETDQVELAGFPPPEEGTPDFISKYESSNILLPDMENTITTRAPQTILKLPLFLQRMYSLMESDGVKFYFSCSFTEPIYQNGKIVGIVAEHKNETIKLRSRLVVDASGTKAVIRTSLPADYGIETFKLGPHDVMHVPIRYIVWSKPDEPHPHPIALSLTHIVFLNPSYMENGAIIGVGQPGSYEQANKVLDDFIKSSDWPPFEVIKTERGVTPYRRPPYSLVADGLFCIGDAAAITRPNSGHGVTATWNLCRIATAVINRALKSESYLTKEILWEINVQYFRTQGAQFAKTFAILTALFNFTDKELNNILKKLKFLIGDGPGFLSDFDLNLTAGESLKIAGGLGWDVLAGRISLRHIKEFVGANRLSNKIQKHYKSFPENPTEFKPWVRKAENLWKQKKVIKKEFPSTLIEYR